MNSGKACGKGRGPGRSLLLGLVTVGLLLPVFGWGPGGAAEDVIPQTMLSEDRAMKMTIGDQAVPVVWEDNPSVEALKALCPLTVQMSMYGGFEQVGALGASLPRNDVQTTTQAGDIVLYSGNQLVVFYGSNSWAYTRLGHIDLPPQEMRALLGSGDATIILE